jgi:hypothetical protein
MKSTNKTESIKVDSKTKKKVIRHIKNTRQTIGGFYDLAAQEKIDRDLHIGLSQRDAQKYFNQPTQ